MRHEGRGGRGARRCLGCSQTLALVWGAPAPLPAGPGAGTGPLCAGGATEGPWLWRRWWLCSPLMPSPFSQPSFPGHTRAPREGLGSHPAGTERFWHPLKWKKHLPLDTGRRRNRSRAKPGERQGGEGGSRLGLCSIPGNKSSSHTAPRAGQDRSSCSPAPTPFVSSCVSPWNPQPSLPSRVSSRSLPHCAQFLAWAVGGSAACG